MVLCWINSCCLYLCWDGACWKTRTEGVTQSCSGCLPFDLEKLLCFYIGTQQGFSWGKKKKMLYLCSQVFHQWIPLNLPPKKIRRISIVLLLPVETNPRLSDSTEAAKGDCIQSSGCWILAPLLSGPRALQVVLPALALPQKSTAIQTFYQ